MLPDASPRLFVVSGKETHLRELGGAALAENGIE